LQSASNKFIFVTSNQNMRTQTEVAVFLNDFKEKMKIWSVLFRDDRGKNTQALLDLAIRPNDRKTILETLETQDYCQGPLQETLYGGSDMWVFGKSVQGQEVYIKITLGAMGSSVICISFHLAEYPMRYPLK
jgi:hypothetical protein